MREFFNEYFIFYLIICAVAFAFGFIIATTELLAILVILFFSFVLR